MSPSATKRTSFVTTAPEMLSLIHLLSLIITYPTPYPLLPLVLSPVPRNSSAPPNVQFVRPLVAAPFLPLLHPSPSLRNPNRNLSTKPVLVLVADAVRSHHSHLQTESLKMRTVEEHTQTPRLKLTACPPHTMPRLIRNVDLRPALLVHSSRLDQERIQTQNQLRRIAKRCSKLVIMLTKWTRTRIRSVRVPLSVDRVRVPYRMVDRAWVKMEILYGRSSTSSGVRVQ